MLQSMHNVLTIIFKKNHCIYMRVSVCFLSLMGLIILVHLSVCEKIIMQEHTDGINAMWGQKKLKLWKEKEKFVEKNICLLVL